jgi:hypothetical protein
LYRALTVPAAGKVFIRLDRLTLGPKRREAMLSELEYVLRTHGDHEVLSDQASLRDVLTDLRRLADDLGLDFGSALARAEVEDDPLSTPEAFDPRI